VQTDLETEDGIDALYDAACGRPVDVLIANAGASGEPSSIRTSTRRGR